MAKDWIPMRADLAEDPAVIAIGLECGLDEFAVVGRLHRLWSWVNLHLASGNARGVTSEWVDRYLSTTGFAAAMQNAGWLRTRTGGIEFPNFERWNSKGAKRRILTAQRVSQSRYAKSNAENVTGALTKEEKRREDTKGKDPPNPPPVPSSPPPPPSKQNGEDVPIPSGLDSGPFPAAWREWLAERISRGNRVSVRAAGLQLKKLEPLGPARAAECVRASIANGWIGVFPERFTGTGGGVSATNVKPKYESPAERDVREFRERLAVVAQTKLQMEEERHGGPDADGPGAEPWDAADAGPGRLP